MAAASHRSTPSLWRDQTVSSSLRAFSFADDILSPAPLAPPARPSLDLPISSSPLFAFALCVGGTNSSVVEWSAYNDMRTGSGGLLFCRTNDQGPPPDRWQNQRRPRPSPIERLPPPFPRSPLRLVPRTIGDFPLMTGVKLFPLLRPRCGQKSSILKQSP